MAIEPYKTKMGVRYKATLWHKNKVVARESFNRKIDAQEWLHREKIKIQDTKVGRRKGDSVTLREFFSDVYSIHHGVRPATWPDYKRIYDNHFDKVFGLRKLSAITEEDWATLLKSYLQNGMSGARRNRLHAVASAIYTVGLKWRYVSYNPLTLVEYEEEPLKDFNYWTFGETRIFFEWAQQNSRFFSLYYLLYESGMRISEALGLKWDVVDFNSGTISIRRAYSREAKQLEDTTKSGRKRTIWMSPGIRTALLDLKRNKISEFVFTQESGATLTYCVVRKAFGRDQVSAGIGSPIGVHDIRHTFASHFVMKGGSIYDLKTLMGHSDVNTTMRYAHLAEDHLKERSSLVQLALPSHDNVIKLA